MSDFLSVASPASFSLALQAVCVIHRLGSHVKPQQRQEYRDLAKTGEKKRTVAQLRRQDRLK